MIRIAVAKSITTNGKQYYRENILVIWSSERKYLYIDICIDTYIISYDHNNSSAYKKTWKKTGSFRYTKKNCGVFFRKPNSFITFVFHHYVSKKERKR
jgi:hypothetical protein